MKHELDKMMSLIKDYKTGYGGVTDSFMRKELELFAKDYHIEQCNIANVVGRSEQFSFTDGTMPPMGSKEFDCYHGFCKCKQSCKT